MAIVCKHCIVCLLLVSVLLQTFSQAVICVDFYANRDYIARTLCENRDKPMMHCGGRCQLCKRLNRDQDQQDKGVPTRKGNERVVTLFHRTWDSIRLEAPGTARVDYRLPVSDDRVVDRAETLFHPPD